MSKYNLSENLMVDFLVSIESIDKKIDTLDTKIDTLKIYNLSVLIVTGLTLLFVFGLYFIIIKK